MKQTYSLVDMSKVPPITFNLGEHTFHVPRKQRPDVVQMLTAGVTLNENGDREYSVALMRTALIVLMATELYDEEAGAWVPVNEGERLIDLLNSPRFEITGQELGELCWDLVEEITGHPTHALRPSSAGTERTDPTPTPSV